MLTRKSVPFAVKALADDGTFELYAAVFGNVDRQDQVIAPNAFTNLDAFVRDGWGDVNHAWNGLGVATIDAATQDQVGLKIRGRFHSTPDAQEVRTKVRERLERGKTAPCSIGFRVLDSAVETRDGRRIEVLKAIELYEFSFVALPANPAAGVTRIKGLIGLPEIRERLTAVKSGRTVSKANHARLSAWCGALDQHGAAAQQLAAEMKAWLDGHKPDQDDDDDESEPGSDPGSDADDRTEKRATLKRRSLQARSRLAVV